MLEVDEAEVMYSEPAESVPALLGISCQVRPGELMAIVGANGSGKTTLGRLMCGMQVSRPGMICVDGHDPARSKTDRLAVRRLVGFCRQNPIDQIVSSNVNDEVAFGPRNLGLDESEVGERTKRALDRCGLAGFEMRDTAGLSGGEQQRLALAGVLAMQPRYLVLDEPTSQLDAAARPWFRDLVAGLAHTDGVGIALITHDPLEALLADSVLVLCRGEVRWEGPPLDLVLHHGELWDETLLPDPYVDALRVALAAGLVLDGRRALPSPEKLATWLVDHDAAPGDCGTAFAWAAGRASFVACEAGGAEPVGDARTGGLRFSNVSFSYGDHPALEDVDLEAHAGRVTLVSGPSGSGKSTLARIGAGLYEPDRGIVELAGAVVRAGHVGLSFQNPEQQFFLDTVEDEIGFAPRNLGYEDHEVDRRVRSAAGAAGVENELLGRDPFSLSGGQARRVAIASILSLDADCYLFDEPTAGLDVQGRRYMHRVVRDLASAGAVIVVISHDVVEWAVVADVAAMLCEGRVVWRGPSSVLLSDMEPFEACGLEAPICARLNAAFRAADMGGGR